MAGGPNTDEAKVRLYADGSSRTTSGSIAQGVEYRNSYIAERWIEPSTDDCLIWSGSEEAWPFVEQARRAARTLPEVRRHGRRALRDGRAGQTRRRAGVRVQFDARALALIADAAGRVHGVVVPTASRATRAPPQGSCSARAVS